MKTNEPPFFAAMCFACILTLAIGLLLGTVFSPPAPEALASQAIRGSWLQGELPLGMPVIGIWKHAGEIVTIPCIRTDFAGLYEYTMVGRAVRPLPDPDFWSPLPGVNP